MVYMGGGVGEGVRGHDIDLSPRRDSGPLRMSPGGRQHKSAERQLARQWPIRPEVPFCHKERDVKTPVDRPLPSEAVVTQRHVVGHHPTAAAGAVGHFVSSQNRRQNRHPLPPRTRPQADA